MPTHEHVFIAADEPIETVAEVLGESLGRRFEKGADGDLLLMVGRTAVNLGQHDYDDDDTEDPLTRYPYEVEVRDLDKDRARQRRIAEDVFGAAIRDRPWAAVHYFTCRNESPPSSRLRTRIPLADRPSERAQTLPSTESQGRLGTGIIRRSGGASGA
jgi:hypothetical protein